ncbi:unnamed protein product [Didymodactylos carnosus]|nr:unnamed protein product [Didymodactylos carnosus]CAF4472120.1 unnamed protein product [Didymodactylos carnosus]
MFALRQIVQDPTTVSEVISAVKDVAPYVLGVTATTVVTCKLSAQFKTWLENNKKEVEESEKDRNGEPTPAVPRGVKFTKGYQAQSGKTYWERATDGDLFVENVAHSKPHFEVY